VKTSPAAASARSTVAITTTIEVGNTWTYNNLDASTEPIGIALALDADDHPHIAFFAAGGGTAYGLYYVHWTGLDWDNNGFQVSGNVWNDG
jgi:hypothetical protein